MAATFDEQYESLLANLAEAVRLLRRWREDRWADWLQTDATRIENGDAFGLDHLLQAFGGMGSLNDLVIHPMNGDDISPDEVGPVNDRLHELRGCIWRDAQAVRHEVR